MKFKVLDGDDTYFARAIIIVSIIFDSISTSVRTELLGKEIVPENSYKPYSICELQ